MPSYPPRIHRWEKELNAAALCYGLDAALLGAIMDRESLGGDALEPKGPIGKGDHGNGCGLMQLDVRTHRLFIQARFEDVKTEVWTDPAFNVLYGARLLRRYMDQFAGDVAAGVGAYNAGPSRVAVALVKVPSGAPLADRVAAVDPVTTLKNYVSDVLRRRDEFTGAVT